MTSEHIKLAQELHDGIAQDLVGLGYSIDSLIAHQIEVSNRTQLRAVRLGVSDLIDKVRREIFELRQSQSPLMGSFQSNFIYESQKIFGEIIRNVEQHSQASILEVTVLDNGTGGAQEKEGSFGLVGLQERVSKLNGDIQIESSEKGTKIHFTIPLDR